MRYSRKVVDADPKRASVAFHMTGERIRFVFQLFLYVIGNSLNLSIGVPFANNEVVGGRIFQPSHIQLDDVLAFNVLNTFNDQFVERFSGEPVLLNFGV